MSDSKPMVLGFIPIRAAQALFFAIALGWFAMAILDGFGVISEPPETLNIAFMAILSPLVGAMMAAKKEQGPPPEIRAAEAREDREKEPDAD